MDWNCSVAAHGESLEHVPRGFLISRCKEGKWPHYRAIKYPAFLSLLENVGALRSIGGNWPSWLHLILLYLSSIFFGPWDVCHGNSTQRVGWADPCCPLHFPAWLWWRKVSAHDPEPLMRKVLNYSSGFYEGLTSLSAPLPPPSRPHQGHPVQK